MLKCKHHYLQYKNQTVSLFYTMATAQKQEIATALAPVLEQTYYDLLARLERPQSYVMLYDGRLPEETADAIRSLGRLRDPAALRALEALDSTSGNGGVER